MYLVINKCVTAVKVSNFSGHYLRNRLLSYKKAGSRAIVVLMVSKHYHDTSLASDDVTPHYTQGQTLIRLVS
jgi:hypothetical protein